MKKKEIKTKLLTLLIEKELYDSFKAAAKAVDMDMSKLNRGFIRDFVKKVKDEQENKINL